MKKALTLLLITFGFAGLCQSQTTIAQWTFETTQPAGTPGAGIWLTNIAAEVGSGTASAWHAGAATYSSPAGNGSAHSFSANTWAVGDFYQFSVKTVGFTGIGISYDQTSSSTGPNRFSLQHSTDGVTFSTFGSSFLVLTNATSANNSDTGLLTGPWSSGGAVQSAYSYVDDLTAVGSLNNAGAVYFRLVCNTAPGSSGGTDRVDNFTVFSPIPEPSTLCLVVLGGFLGLVALQRKR